ncbi:MAG: YkvA family protein [Pseudomonadota bacterium]
MRQVLRDWARGLKLQALTLWFAARHPETPWLARTLAAFAAAYAFSPIDLIPDFIPVLGYLDDALLLPVLILIAMRLIPDHVWSECRERARERADRPVSRAAAGAIVLIWLGLAWLAVRLLAG